MLSFIVPVYKTPQQLLRNCLDSVLRYSLPMELICILDSPGDPCEQVLDEYAAREPRVRLLKNDRNRGVSYSRNRGLDAAEGEYVAFVDADDEIVAAAYERAMGFVEDCRLGGCAVARNNSKHLAYGGVDYGGRVSGALKDPQVGHVLAGAFGWAVYPAVLRRSLLTERHVRFVEGRRYGEDFVCMTSILCTGGLFGFLNEDGYKSVGHAGSTCKAMSDVDNYLQGLMSSLDVLSIAVKADISRPAKAWYLTHVLQLSLLHRSIGRYVRGDDRRVYCSFLKKFFNSVALDCSDVASVGVRLVAFWIRRWPRLWFALGELGSFLLKVLNHYNALVK